MVNYFFPLAESEESAFINIECGVQAGTVVAMGKVGREWGGGEGGIDRY